MAAISKNIWGVGLNWEFDVCSLIAQIEDNLLQEIINQFKLFLKHNGALNKTWYSDPRAKSGMFGIQMLRISLVIL